MKKTKKNGAKLLSGRCFLTLLKEAYDHCRSLCVLGQCGKGKGRIRSRRAFEIICDHSVVEREQTLTASEFMH
jgi:hypothetical protein